MNKDGTQKMLLKIQSTRLQHWSKMKGKHVKTTSRLRKLVQTKKLEILGCTLAAVALFCLKYHYSTKFDRQTPLVRNRSMSFPWHSQKLRSHGQNITIEGDNFLLNGEPLWIMSGSVHYFRIPCQYWRDRLRKLKAMGLNAVSTYVEWSYHEPEERQYLFEGDRNVVQFVRIAAEEGLFVLLRPGPYICAERDLGGLPYWLLGKYPKIKLRSTDQDFIQETKTWMSRLFKHISPMLLGNGGPIILVQVENEYGSYGNDKRYMEQIRDIILHHVGTNALLYTVDGKDMGSISNGAVNGTLTTIDFEGGGPISMDVFNDLQEYMPHRPLMTAELYSGWMTHWSEPLRRVADSEVLNFLALMLKHKVSFNFYVFSGGTNFEFTSGANNFDNKYQPQLTSYDYDAPLNEAGDPTSKYYAIRNAILLKYDLTFIDDTPVPQPSPKGAYGTVKVKKRINLLSPKGRSTFGRTYENVTGEILPTFESLRQRAGLILYETTLQIPCTHLHIAAPRDWIYVYLDRRMQGILNRMFGSYYLNSLKLDGMFLSLLVENQGRINYGNSELLHDYKGILSAVKCNDKTVNSTWQITGYPLNLTDMPLPYDPDPRDITRGPVVYEGYFELPSGPPLDTFIDTTGWIKGYIWINGHNLGRYWPIAGPQVTLYVPGVWLRPTPQKNQIIILELEQLDPPLAVKFIDHPILNGTAAARSAII